MPFNILSLLVTQQNLLTLDYAGGSGGYNIENQLVNTHGVSSSPAMIIILTITGDANAPSAAGLAIDGGGLHAEAILRINLVSADVNAVGGRGGNGGKGEFIFDPFTPSWIADAGVSGFLGGDAIRLGCPTTIQGSGVVRAGTGGGGGGGGWVDGVSDHVDGGGGGGGGAPNGAKGIGGPATGAGTNHAGSDGTDATETVKGDGGSTTDNGGAGGNGGEDGTAAQNGSTGSQSGGSAGSDGFTVVQNGYTLTKEGSVTYEGSEEA